MKGFTRPLEPNQHPLLIAKPVWMPTNQLFRTSESIFSRPSNFYLCIVDAPVLSLLGWNGSSTGIVVSVDTEVATVACVYNGEIVEQSVFFDPKNPQDSNPFSPQVLAEMTHTCLQECKKKYVEEMVKCVYLRGVRTLDSTFDEQFSVQLSKLGVAFHLASNHEKVRDVIRGATIFITSPLSRQKFFHYESGQLIPGFFTTPGNVSWSGALYLLSNKEWKRVFAVIDRKKRTFSMWNDQSEYQKKQKPLNEMLIEPLTKIEHCSIESPKVKTKKKK